MELSSTLHAIGAHDHKLAMRELKVLSGLVYDQRGEFWPTWAAISPHRRAEIARAMVDLAEDNVDLDFAQALLWMLDDDDAEVRASAAEGLWESENLAVLRRLVAVLRADPAPAVRAAAAIALAGSAYRAELGELDDRDAQALRDALLAAVRDERQPLEVRRRSLESAGYFAGEDEIQRRVGLAYQSDEQLWRESALVAMGRSMLPRWHASIAESLANKSPALRYEAARAVGELGEDGQALLSKLAQLLADPDTEVALASIWALGQIGGEAAKRLLKQVVKEGDESRRQAAADALDELSQADGLLA